eukprot:CAMPEP_0119135118 /NCGR_PEP_ID=MMETSP1310-20130426/18682_1 /TAXON_ID=464262 /ORGANISM="Genus nov. species nov., Strain RCC2339" /LENGTH=129 /DNA_ID=CAMNT_0007125975 /DNA_START=125 /DNA_END=511 /DNA_ORIENTATION=+
MTEAGHLLFVYGTLQRGYPNEHELRVKGTAAFKCEAITMSPYPLAITNQYFRPWLLDKQGLGHQVAGEVWVLDDACLEYVDAFEGKDFTRTPISVEAPNGDILSCTSYLVNYERNEEWHGPFLTKYPKE